MRLTNFPLLSIVVDQQSLSCLVYARQLSVEGEFFAPTDGEHAK